MLLKVDLTKWRDTTCSQIRRFDIVVMLVFLILMYRCNITLIKIPADYIVETEKLILKFTCKCKGPRII